LPPPKRLLRFNWLISPCQATPARGGRWLPAASTSRGKFLPRVMPDIEITEECRALLAAESPLEEIGQRLPNGNWQMPVDAKTWERLQKLRLRGESISDCIIRLIIIAAYRLGLR
jgi:hypothetical protein